MDVQKKICNTLTVSASNMEPVVSHAPLATEKTKGLDPSWRLHIHSRRYRLTDADGVSGKAAIDGIVHAGLLPDDSAAYIQEVTYSQEKVRKPKPEETIIYIQEA